MPITIHDNRTSDIIKLAIIGFIKMENVNTLIP